MRESRNPIPRMAKRLAEVFDGDFVPRPVPLLSLTLKRDPLSGRFLVEIMDPRVVGHGATATDAFVDAMRRAREDLETGTGRQTG